MEVLKGLRDARPLVGGESYAILNVEERTLLETIMLLRFGRLEIVKVKDGRPVWIEQAVRQISLEASRA